MFIDLVYLDLFPWTTRELAAFEKQFGLSSGGNESARRSKLATAWSTNGRTSPDYIQRTLQAAGFTVYVHEWWSSGPPYVARDPRLYTTHPLIGMYQCERDPTALPSMPGGGGGDTISRQWQCFDSGPGDPLAPHCDDTLANDPGYIVNLDLTRRAPPPVPDDPSKWPYFIYVGGKTFGEREPVPASRIPELKELLLRICPAEQWIVLLITAAEETGGYGAVPFGGSPAGA